MLEMIRDLWAVDWLGRLIVATYALLVMAQLWVIGEALRDGM